MLSLQSDIGHDIRHDNGIYIEHDIRHDIGHYIRLDIVHDFGPEIGYYIGCLTCTTERLVY